MDIYLDSDGNVLAYLDDDKGLYIKQPNCNNFELSIRKRRSNKEEINDKIRQWTKFSFLGTATPELMKLIFLILAALKSRMISKKK